MSEPFLGEVSCFAFGYEPEGWAPCDGREMPIAQNQALYSLLGTTYGGDGETSFMLPKIAPLDAQGATLNWRIATLGRYPPRS